MTLEQFISACLGLVLIALGRLLDQKLPPTESHPAVPAPVSPQVPSIADLDVIREPGEDLDEP